ncbi:MAG: DUF11 domain-containing protein, partial [Candidatus Gracilibacteria bacterium]|nr:DUF11 domain-containing protein [Candidatus Gracilibacteria bacterium]
GGCSSVCEPITIPTECTDISEGNMVRFNSSYDLYFTWHNNDNIPVYLNKYNVSFEHGDFFDSGEDYDFTTELVNNGYSVNANSSMKVLQTGSPWRIDQHPDTRSPATVEDHDFVVKYKFDYDYSNNFPDDADDVQLGECQYFSVTWCGDGVLDAPYETCDPNDVTQAGWGPDGCSSTCSALNHGGEISITKTDVNPDDVDGILRNDFQEIGINTSAIFEITVENTGTTILQDVVVTDVDTPECDLTLPGTLAPGQSHTYTCTSEVITSPRTFRNIADVTANLQIDPSITVTDTDFTTVFMQGAIPSIDINNTAPDGITDFQQVDSGSGATYLITVTNDGAEDLLNVVVTNDRLPQCERTIDLNVEGDANGVFDIGEVISYTCDELNITAANISHIATVTADPIVTPTPVTDSDATAAGTESIVPTACTNLVSDKYSGRSPFTAELGCTGDNVTSYQIEIRDPQGNVVTSSGASATVDVNIRGTYTASCIADNITPTPAVCTKSLTYSTGGGGSTTTCLNISVTADQVQCNGRRARSFWFDCGNGNNLFNATGEFSRSECNQPGYEPIDDFTNVDISCHASRSSGITETDDSRWRSRNACEYDGGSGGPYCGDGALQRPNKQGFMEQCDDANNIDDDNCSNRCTLNINTHPYGVDILVGPESQSVVIGDNMDVYQSHEIPRPFVKNNFTQEEGINSASDHDYFIDQLCVYKSEGNSLIPGSGQNELQCATVGRVLYPGDIADFNGEPVFLGDTSGISGGDTSELNRLEITLKETDSPIVKSAFFAKHIDVTVLKPTIATTGGGTAYIKNNNNISDIYEDTDDIEIDGFDREENRNFIGPTIGEFSSYTKKFELNFSKIALQESIDLNKNLQEKLTYTNDNGNFSKYNGMDDVYYVKGDYSIGSTFKINENPVDFSDDDGVSKTYIVEGDLTITENIEYSGNVAFIVKGGNLIINSDVTNISGTYIVLKDGDDRGGNIMGDTSTTKQLVVKGSLYGNTDDLLSKRTYIKNNSNGQIDVGTIVSFGSSVFRKPAPLTTKFINEYLESEKIAK